MRNMFTFHNPAKHPVNNKNARCPDEEKQKKKKPLKCLPLHRHQFPHFDYTLRGGVAIPCINWNPPCLGGFFGFPSGLQV